MRFLKAKKTAVLYLFFIIIALTQGLVYSFKLPFAQVPDELTHYQFIESEFGTTGYTDELYASLYYPSNLAKLPGNPDIRVDQAALNKAGLTHFTKPLSLSSFHPHINILRHLPCGIGFYLGIAMELPILWCTCLAEIFSVSFFVIIGYFTLKIVPVKKEIFAFCMLIPQTLQMCSSVNYDAVLIPCSFLLFALILKLYYDDKPIHWLDLLPVILCSFVIAVVKLPYLFLSLTIFIIPLNRFSLKIGHRFEVAQFIRRSRFLLFFLFIILTCAGLYLFQDNSLVKLFLGDILSPSQFISLLRRTWNSLGYYHLIQMVGMFGWIDSQVSSVFMLIFFMMIVYLNSAINETDINKNLNTPRRIWLFIVFVLIILMIEMIFQEWSYSYLDWDITVDLASYRSYIPLLGNILGVQGRYWIPCLPVLLVSLHGQAQRKHKILFWFAQIVFYIWSFVNVMNILNVRYW